MNSKYLKVSLIAGLVLAVVFALIKWQISVGIILGLAFFCLYFFLLTMNMHDVIDRGLEEGGRILTIGPKIVRLFVLFLPFLAAYLLPEYVNFIGCAIGLLMFKICTIVVSIFE